MQVCQDCGSHRIVETGGSEQTFECPTCGLTLTAAEGHETDEGMVHNTCPAPAVTSEAPPSPDVNSEPEGGAADSEPPAEVNLDAAGDADPNEQGSSLGS